MIQLTAFEKAYLSFLQKRKDKGLPLNRPNPHSKVRLYPVAREYDYARWLEKVFSFPIEGLLQKAKEKASIFMIGRADEEGNEGIWGIFGAELADYQTSLLNGELLVISAALLGFAQGVREFSDTQWQKHAKMTIGEVWTGEDLWAEPLLAQWQAEQIALIQSVGAKQSEKVATIVSEGVRTGKHMRDIATDIEVALQTLDRNKAKLIARDQVGKLYGLIAQQEDTQAGIEEYDWSTSHDERVRGKPGGKYPNATPSHWLMEKRTCQWVNSTVWWEHTGWMTRDTRAPMVHPGMAIQCRCVSISRVDLLFAKLEKQLN